MLKVIDPPAACLVAPIATFLPKNAEKVFTAPPGPASFSARLAVARAHENASTPFWFFVPPKKTAPLTLPPVLLWSWPDCPLMDGRTFWEDGLAPHVIRLEAGNKYAVERRPLAFIVRRGREWADFIALVKQIQRNGEKYDAPFRHIWEWMPPLLGRGQFVSILDDVNTMDTENANETEAHTNG